MGFLRKIFRRNKGDGNNNNSNNNNNTNTTSNSSPTSNTTTSAAVVGNTTTTNNNHHRKSSWRSGGNNNSSSGLNSSKGSGNKGQGSSSLRLHHPQQQQQLVVREDSPTQVLVDDIAFLPQQLSNHQNKRVTLLRGPDESDGTQRPILSPRNNNNNSTSTAATFSNSINHQSKGVLKLTPHISTPVDLDDSQSESMMESIHSRETTSNHPLDETTTMEQDVAHSEQAQSAVSLSSAQRAPIFTMPDSHTGTLSNTMMLPKLRFSAGNVSVGSEDTDGESSSFNLSTDAEDTEYEGMRRRLGATAITVGSSNMDMSVANYTTDGETSVFPGLQSEDDMTQTTASVTKEASQNSILHLPTVNPATGASLVPVGYVTNTNHPYAGSVGFPGVASYNNKNSNGLTASSDRLSNKLKAEEPSNSNKTNSMNGMIKPKDNLDDNIVVETSLPRNSNSHRNGNGNRSTTPTSSSSSLQQQQQLSTIPALEISRRDSPDPKMQRSSPKAHNSNKSFGSSNNNAGNHGNNNNNDSSSSGFTQFNSNFPTEAIYGSPATTPNNNSSSISNQHQQPPTQRRSFTSPKQAPSTTTTTTTTSAVVDNPSLKVTTKSSLENFDPFTMETTTNGFTSSNDIDLFADFADFSNFDNAFKTSNVPSQPSPIKEPIIPDVAVLDQQRRSAASPFIERPDEKARTTRHSSIGSTTSNFSGRGNNHQNQNYRSNNSTTTSSALSGAAHNDTSLSELLEKAKSKSSRSSSHAKKASTSVNSAPAHMTASYLRQHHNLPGSSKSRSSKGGDGASVTDIIQSLEAANATRLISGGSSSHSLGGGVARHGDPSMNGKVGGGIRSRDDGFSSAHSRDGGSSVLSKEKMRRRRERRHARGVDANSSDSDNDHEENESWLFDEVTGALGPRGIAADLESLSGRSNRSSSSRGNKSLRSHRSHKSGSRSSRHRRPKTDSADSVDSHHSRDSRRSRGSRYSHRSTRSYISQMSEQSRSVANDLLRLEMQLAMVGSAGVPGLEGGSSSVGGIARSTRSLSARVTPPVTTPSSSIPSTTSATGARRMATARRSRITIQAPAGRLGIILANKADARGTVVSGVRSSSALVDRITPGDRIVAIDGEDVSLMTVSEITTIMARKADFERTLTVLTTPRHTEQTLNTTTGSVNSPRSASDSFQQHRTSYRG